MSAPQVSLLMPAFIRDDINLAYFQTALESALAQTYPYLEILVIDDGSPHGEPLANLVRRQPAHVRYVRKPNGGVASALNVGLKEMTGAYFTWLSHDDLYLPRKIEAQMAQAQRAASDVIFYCDVEHIDPQGGHLFFEHTPDLAPQRCRTFFAQYGAFNANAHLIPRRCFDRVGGFDESLRTTQDNHMWFRLAEHFVFQRVPEVLMKYRHHPTQDSQSPIHLRECNELFTYFLANLSREEIVRHAGATPGRYYAECACLRRNRGYWDAARDATRRATLEVLRHPWRERGTFGIMAGLWFSRPSAPTLSHLGPPGARATPA